ncbi:hypothetical protein AKJ09_04097 [Labilithrix luteola]|uniref:Uncharacterized protein n=1 Tax=Labilithrix luteola TaxID=1391654 RepID=A0A0K1PV74_9BACT|nr:hypothetical protein [Labilithrix luteola]AKU97433.1 hypothetical protein AKJ09_04097 [Labilithrix luteola]
MDDQTKNVFDVVFTAIGLLGAAIGFAKAIHEWREGQRWKRSERLDRFVETFESTPLLKLACTILDWTTRQVKFDGRDVLIENRDVLLALRNHAEEPAGTVFTGEQALIRDAYDAFLAFFARLELAIATGLVEAEPAKSAFAYWLDQYATMKVHPGEAKLNKELRARSPAQMAVVYLTAYGQPLLIGDLCERFDVVLWSGKPKEARKKTTRTSDPTRTRAA